MAGLGGLEARRAGRPAPHLHDSDGFPELAAPADPRPNAAGPGRRRPGGVDEPGSGAGRASRPPLAGARRRPRDPARPPTRIRRRTRGRSVSSPWRSRSLPSLWTSSARKVLRGSARISSGPVGPGGGGRLESPLLNFSSIRECLVREPLELGIRQRPERPAARRMMDLQAPARLGDEARTIAWPTSSLRATECQVHSPPSAKSRNALAISGSPPGT